MLERMCVELVLRIFVRSHSLASLTARRVNIELWGGRGVSKSHCLSPTRKSLCCELLSFNRSCTQVLHPLIGRVLVNATRTIDQRTPYYIMSVTRMFCAGTMCSSRRACVHVQQNTCLLSAIPWQN